MIECPTPDITVYIEALDKRILGQTLERVRVASPFLLRTIEPPVNACVGRTVTALRRVGKRIAIGFDNDVWLVLHLMIAGRLHWRERRRSPTAAAPSRRSCSIRHASLLTEAGSQKRASLHLAAGEAGLAALDPGGIDVLTASLDRFTRALTVREPHSEARSDRSAHCSAASATRIRTRSCTAPGFRPSR